jgi:nitric oxide reductase NorD protein
VTQALTQGVDRYDFVASAIAGRKVSVHASPHQQVDAFSDGHSITVSVGDDTSLSVAVQAALIGARSLDPAIMRILAGRRRLAERYLYCEVLRATQLCADRLPLSVTRRPELSDPLTETALQSLSCAKGNTALPSPPQWFGSIRPVRVLRKAVSEEGVSALMRGGNNKVTTVAARDLDDDDAGEESKILKLFQSPVAIQNPLSSLLNALLGAGIAKGTRDRSGTDGGGAEVPVGRIEHAFRRGVHAILSRWPALLPTPEPTVQTPMMTFPEWDIHRNRYRTNWVSIAEVDAWRPDGEQGIWDIHSPSLELQRQLSSLGLDHEMHRRQKDGADLDTGALIDCAIDLRTGHSPPAINIYRASRKTRRDLAVAIIIDISGSTGEADARGHSVFGRHVQVAYSLGSALDALGDTVAMFGFHSWGRERVRVVRLKGQGERWSGEVRRRIGQLEAVGYTRIGAAIRYGADLLQTGVRLPNRLLILITDGIAYDQDYERNYAEGDASKALEEAKNAGTACVCISIGGSTEVAKLQSIFGAANLLVVDDVEQVTGRIRAACRDALDRVSRRRVASHV